MIRERLGKRIVIAALVVLALFGGLVAFIGFAGESALIANVTPGCVSALVGEQYARAKNDGTNLPSAYRVPERHPTM